MSPPRNVPGFKSYIIVYTHYTGRRSSAPSLLIVTRRENAQNTFKMTLSTVFLLNLLPANQQLLRTSNAVGAMPIGRSLSLGDVTYTSSFEKPDRTLRTNRRPQRHLQIVHFISCDSLHDA